MEPKVNNADLWAIGPSSTIYDLTFEIHSASPTWDSPGGLGPDHRLLAKCRAKGDICNGSELRLPAHTGTHLDSPGHFVDEAYDQGIGVESLNLEILNGPALLLRVPGGSNITAGVLQQLHVPANTRRLLLKTDNTDRDRMSKTAFDTAYTALTKDGAQWLVGHTAVQLIGIDYLSIAIYEDLTGPHSILLGQGVIPVEGLDLRNINPGAYMLHCLPLKLAGSDGAPVRCVAMS
ncbi:hypothetical protein WJX72_011965 [[Myrmecia] bisecta]|uniref:Cyclase n=1 Tax=[Myrmecia] bisecta TaxID=41462 RepID=A0AAW1QTU3_9CHLO